MDANINESLHESIENSLDRVCIISDAITLGTIVFNVAKNSI